MSCNIHQKILVIFYYDIDNIVQGFFRKCNHIKNPNTLSIVCCNEEVKHYHDIDRSDPVCLAMSNDNDKYFISALTISNKYNYIL